MGSLSPEAETLMRTHEHTQTFWLNGKMGAGRWKIKGKCGEGTQTGAEKDCVVELWGGVKRREILRARIFWQTPEPPPHPPSYS